VELKFKPIGRIHSCFKEKFGIPRQPNLVEKAPGKVIFFKEFAREEAIRELDAFSHIWLIFCFHKSISQNQAWAPMVRPPRLGGNKKVGVFASRSPFRPNPMGMSCVRLDRIEITDQGPVLHLLGVDLMDGTPVLDIKPYLPYSDSLPDARDGFAKGPPEAKLKVAFTDQARADIEKRTELPNLKEIVTGILAHDPRPAYTREGEAGRIYGIRLFDFDLKFTLKLDEVQVLALESV
jgi:tRNA-Thr(GGU) m(6)t(6)A37 methyltransferase TsaA